MESVLNFQIHQRVDSVVSRCYNAFRYSVQRTNVYDCMQLTNIQMLYDILNYLLKLWRVSDFTINDTLEFGYSHSRRFRHL